ncbi:hypothetical protein ACFFU9_11095 [Mariniflexile ostreae]|uniref:Uncharacterized protein n=1 Tax=Mariniflexile ostreae TaxID=1520892 RepID=A0ABV5FD25_9FLAO
MAKTYSITTKTTLATLRPGHKITKGAFARLAALWREPGQILKSG